TSLRRSSAKAPSSTRRSSHRYSATRYRAKSARIADWSPAAIRLISALSESEGLSRGAAHSSDVAAPSPRTQTVAIGDIPYIPASPTTDRQPKMKLQSHCPSLDCEVVAGGSRLLTSYYLVRRYHAATPSVPPVQLLARTLSPGVSDDVTLS